MSNSELLRIKNKQKTTYKNQKTASSYFMWSYFLPAPLYSSCALMPNDKPKRSQKPMLPVWTRCMT